MNDTITLENIFFVIGVFSTILFILKMSLYYFTGGDVEVESSFDAISETDISFNFISIQSILAFLMGFGWCGLSALNGLHVNGYIAFTIAIASGILLLYVSSYLMFLTKKLAKTVQPDINELVNKQGKAYTHFPPKEKGQIEIDFNGKLSVLDAYNLSEAEIKAFTIIKVSKIENNNIYIEQGE